MLKKPCQNQLMTQSLSYTKNWHIRLIISTPSLHYESDYLSIYNYLWNMNHSNLWEVDCSTLAQFSRCWVLLEFFSRVHLYSQGRSSNGISFSWWWKKGKELVVGDNGFQMIPTKSQKWWWRSHLNNLCNYKTFFPFGSIEAYYKALEDRV